MLSLEHSISLALHIKAIEFVRFKDKLLCLIIGDSIEDNIETAGHDTTVLRLTSHRVCFTTASHSIGK